MKNIIKAFSKRMIVIVICALIASITVFAANDINLKDGSYPVKLTMKGGSGKASVMEDTFIDVNNGQAALRVLWSSPNYDYMVVDGVTYYPVNTEGNSEFRIPINKLNEEFKVIGDTVAMSTPHEIEYTFTVTMSDKSKEKITSFLTAFILLVVIVIIQYNKNTKKIIEDARNDKA